VHVVIMGCGRVGSTLARSLEDRNHTVSVIDADPDAFRRLGPGFNGDKVTGQGFDQEVLEKAGVRRADAFAAVSSGDNSNIIAARVARETFGRRAGLPRPVGHHPGRPPLRPGRVDRPAHGGLPGGERLPHRLDRPAR
jgi:2-polyprenyl-6-methoxyphenol hydroxylase-like FAD-dependent oxidoreductase